MCGFEMRVKGEIRCTVESFSMDDWMRKDSHCKLSLNSKLIVLIHDN